MTYLGSKRKYIKDICPIINKYIKENSITNFYDIFCGGAIVSQNIECENIYANDLSPTLIALHQQAQKDFSQIPNEQTREQFNFAKEQFNIIIKNLSDKNTLEDYQKLVSIPLYEIGALEWYASFSARGFNGGYGAAAGSRNYFDERRRNHLKQSQDSNYQKIKFSQSNYTKLEIPPNALIYCFDKDTEIMTKDGWKFFKDIDINKDLFFSREPETKKLDYLKAIQYHHYNYNGKMFHYTGRQLDFCVTSDHKIFYNKKYGRAKKRLDGFLPANDFSQKNSNYCFVKSGGIWEGKNDTFFDLCGQKVNFCDFCYLLGIFITDGCINNQDNISISQTKTNIILKIKEILEKLDIKYSEHDIKNGGKEFYISRIYIPFFKQFYLKERRRIPDIFKNATVPALKRLMEGIIDGDGIEGRKIIAPTKQLVSDYQEILFKIGLASNVSVRQPHDSYLKAEDRIIHGTKEYYIVSILKTEYPPFYKKNVSWEDYNDEVFCITLEKWHTVLIRRNGKTIWLGQCDSPYKNTTPYGINPKFNHFEYYNWLREKSKTNPIFISEEQMPDDFPIVWSKDVIRTPNQYKKKDATEHLYFIDNRN